MGVIDASNWMERLDRSACRELLTMAPVGRVAFVVEGDPELFPVNFAVDGDDIVFRTAKGTKFDALHDGAPAVFEVDQPDESAHLGWSVIVKGRAYEVTDHGERRRLEELGLVAWAYGDKDHWIRIATDAMTGRRVIALPHERTGG